MTAIIIILFVLYKEMGDNDVVFNSSPLGWIELNALDIPQTDEVSAMLRRGSPRDLLAATAE